MKRTPLKRGKPLRRVSNKTSQRLVKYYRIRDRFMKENWICQVCNSQVATDVHHVRGRSGDLLFDTKFWMAVDRTCHDRIHQNVAWAKSQGYLKPFWR